MLVGDHASSMVLHLEVGFFGGLWASKLDPWGPLLEASGGPKVTLLDPLGTSKMVPKGVPKERVLKGGVRHRFCSILDALGGSKMDQVKAVYLLCLSVFSGLVLRRLAN